MRAEAIAASEVQRRLHWAKGACSIARDLVSLPVLDESSSPITDELVFARCYHVHYLIAFQTEK